MKVVVAPNAFKGTLTASQAAAAIARGVREVWPEADIVEVPVADGGDGTVEALVSANHGEYRTVEVEGPLGDPLQATYGVFDSGAVVEMARASGLTLIPTERRDPRLTSSYGFGQLLDAAGHAGVASIISGIGGAATNDAGAGMAQALGGRLLNATGRELAPGGLAPSELEPGRLSGADTARRSVKVRGRSHGTKPL